MNNIQIWIPVIVAFVSSASTVIGVKIKNKNNDRKLLSEDERKFRLDLKETINEYKQELIDTREELRQSREELQASRDEIRVLREEMGDLRNANLQLTLENHKLVAKVEELSELINNMRNNDSIEDVESEVVQDFDGFHME